MPKASVPESEYQLICQRYAAGESQAKIASTYGCSHATIGNILKRMGQETRVGGGQFWKEDLDASNAQIVDLLDSGLSLSETADLSGITVESLADRLRVLGIYPKYKTRTHRSAEELAKVKQKFRVAYAYGLKHLEIVEKLGITNGQVDRWVEEFGIKRRGRGSWRRIYGKSRATMFKELYEAGFSGLDIAELVECSDSTVYALLNKYYPGVTRTTSETVRKKRAVDIAHERKLMLQRGHRDKLSNLAIKKAKQKS